MSGETERQHLLTLSCVEDDALDEELRVVWEAEVGTRVRRQATLPDVRAGGFDPPETLAAFLDAVRWGAVTSAERDSLQAPFRSGIELEEYQLEPLVRALGQPRVNLLIADDVGLGKTIEAGLIVQELLLRHRLRRVMVVCPATLTLKWRAEMAEKFGLDFTIVDSDCLRDLRRSHGINANPFRVHPLTIVSLGWLPGPRAQRVLGEVLPATPQYPRFFDLLIVDEAHHVAPKAPKANYAIDSQQTRTMRRLAQHFEHRLFLSATPHNGYRESWTALLAMLDPLRFARGVEPDPTARREVVIRRMKDAITRPDGSPRFPARIVRALEVEYSDTDREAHRLLQEFATTRRERLGEDRARRSAADLSTLLLKKRLFSSPIAFAKTIDHYGATLRSKARASTPAPLPEHVPDWLADMELAGQEEADDERRNEAERDQLARAAEFEAVLTTAESDLLDRMLRWGRENGDRVDAKAQVLLDELSETCKPGGKWNDERVVIFSEYRDTQRWLADVLEARGLGGDRLRLLYGGQDEDERERIKNAFQAPPDRNRLRILLGTDAAGEGIDLQLQCHRVINYDIPFNPNRLEQRIGRIDRHGQRLPPEAMHFVGARWEEAPPGSFERDLEFLARVARKVATQVEDLGPVNSILERAIQDHMLGARAVDPMSVQAGQSAQVLRGERDFRERMEAVGDRLRRSKTDLRVDPANLERATATALTLARQPALVALESPAPDARFHVPALSGTWARALVGIPDPLTGRPRPISFDPSAAGDPDLVYAHLGHPLLLMATRLLRAAVWGAEESGLNRVSAVFSDAPELETTLLVGYSRLVIVGADGRRLHEEVFPAGGWLRGGRFQALGTQKLSELLDVTAADAGSARPADGPTMARLAREWETVRAPLLTAIENRAREREQSLRTRLEGARAEEQRRLDDAIDQFRRNLEQALRDPGVQQLELSLFNQERDQLRRDVEAWRQAIADLDKRRDQETAEIERRYADVRRFAFPAAVLFVVPQR